MRLDTNTPHIEREWAEPFLLELRLRGVAGHHIGAALAEIEAHCAESGESAREAFGVPETYAADLMLPVAAAGQHSPRGELVATALGIAGMVTTLAGLGAWRLGTEVELTSGSVAVMALVLVGTVLVARHAEWLLRAVLRRWWVAVAYAIVPVALFVAVLLLGKQPILSVPWTPVLVAGVSLLVAHTVLTLRSRGTMEDPVIGPAAAQGAGTLQDSALSRYAVLVVPWLFPLLTGLMAIPLLFV